MTGKGLKWEADKKDVCMWCESMNARHGGGGTDGYHDNEQRRSRSGEVGLSQFISTYVCVCLCVWVCVTSPPSVWECPWNRLHHSLTPCLYTHLSAYERSSAEEMQWAWTDQSSRSSYTEFCLFYVELNRARASKDKCFFSAFITLERPVSLCHYLLQHRLGTVGQGFTENAIDYANGDNDRTLCIISY